MTPSYSGPKYTIRNERFHGATARGKREGEGGVQDAKTKVLALFRITNAGKEECVERRERKGIRAKGPKIPPFATESVGVSVNLYVHI